jgi:hypothetical protein
MENYLYAVMEAVSLSTATNSQQQLADANSTVMDVNMEQQVTNDWNSQIQAAQANVTYWAQAVSQHPSNKGDAAYLADAQTNFQNIVTQQQTATNACDSATQSEQNATGQDSSNLQQKVQLEAAVNSVSQTLAQALSQSY